MHCRGLASLTNTRSFGGSSFPGVIPPLPSQNKGFWEFKFSLQTGVPCVHAGLAGWIPDVFDVLLTGRGSSCVHAGRKDCVGVCGVDLILLL